MSDCRCHSKGASAKRPIGRVDLGRVFADAVAPLEDLVALQDEFGPQPAPPPDPRLIAYLTRGVGRDGRVGAVVTTAVVATAVATVVARYGPGIIESLWRGLEDLLGINTCSSENKAKHRGRINALLAQGNEGMEEVTRGIQEGRMTGGTGKCLEYALSYASKRVVDIAREMGLPVDDIEALKALLAPKDQASPAQKLPAKEAGKRCIYGRDPVTEECYPDREAARAAHDGERVRESSRCTAPPESLLLGIDSQRYCAMTPAQRAILVEQVAAANLTAAERAELEALPFNLRREHFLSIARARVAEPGGEGFESASGAAEGGGNAVVWLALLALVGGGAYFALRDDDKGSR